MRKNKAAATAIDLRLPLLAIAIVLFALLFSVSAALAQDKRKQGLKVGETIPFEMTATDQSGQTQSLKSVSGRGGLILLFTRSLDW